MPEVICLISSSPPPPVRRSAPPPAIQKSSKPATKASSKAVSTAAVDLDLTSPPSENKQRKTYATNAFSASRTNGATASNKGISASTASASIADPKLNERDYVFLDDDFSSDIDLDKEYSLPVTQVRERAEKRASATTIATSKEPVSKSTSAPTSKSAAVGGTSSTKAAPAAMAKKTQITNKDHVFLDDDFSSSIDIDKEYELNLPATKKRKVTPETYGATKRHGVLDSCASSPKTKKFTESALDAELDDWFGPVQDTAKTNTLASHVAAAKTYMPELPAASTAAWKEPTISQPARRVEKRILDSDPITFTSSPDFAQLNRDRIKRRQQAQAEPKDLSDIDEPVQNPSNAVYDTAARDALDSDSDDLPELAGIGATYRPLSRTTSDTSYLRRSRPSISKSTSFSRSKSLANPAAPKTKRVPKTADEKAAEAADKLAAKEVETERKRLLREEKSRDKIIAQDLAKVNTLKTDKKKSTPEMMVLFPSEFDVKLRQTAEGFLSKLAVEYRSWAGAGVSVGEQLGSGEVKNVVRWKRKVEAVYNDKEDIWEPVPRRTELEKHVLVYLPAVEFVELATAVDGLDLDDHVERLRARWFGYKIIYLIEGLPIWQKKNTNLRNRQFASAVRAQIPADPAPASSQGTTTSSSRARNKKAAPEYVSDDLIEDALLSLQIKHKVLIHYTASLVESAEWISIFTQHISTIPYRLQKMNLDTSFCMESGQVRAGEDARDTFVKMLCEMRGVTAPVGWGIEAEIGGGVRKMIELFKEEGKEALKEVRKSANRDGGFTDRMVGKSISKRVYSVFMGKDAGSTDV